MTDAFLLSWERCLKRGLRQDLISPLRALGREELRRKIEENFPAVSVFTNTVKEIVDYLEGSVFLLCDQEGILLSGVATGRNRQWKMEAGVSFAEESCGTNAVGMAMILNSSVHLRPSHHYCNFLKKYYSYAVPLDINHIVRGYLGVFNAGQPVKKELLAIVDLLVDRIARECNDYYAKEEVSLNEQQLQALNLYARGRTTNAVALELGISVNTVKYHKKRIFQVMGARSISEAVAKAFSMKILAVEEVIKQKN